MLHRHDDSPRVDLAIGIGTWETEESAADLSIFLAIWLDADEIRFGFVDPSESVWSGARSLTNQLSAEDARGLASRSDIFRIAEHITADDPAIARHLAWADLAHGSPWK